MATRYTARSQSRFGVPGLPSGYEGKSTSDIVIPPVGIADVDKALFDLFNEQIPLTVSGEDTESKRVPVVFFAGEKWALNKRLRALKDRNGSLILPLVTAIRTGILQDLTTDITGRGTNQQTGEIVIHRRLDKSDRGYQGLINKFLVKHQTNLAMNPEAADEGQLTTMRTIGELEDDQIVRQGGLLHNDRTNNVYETIVIPAPQFFTAQYDITFWAQYTTHMNQMIEAMISSFLPQGNTWKLDTPKGYWFLASVDGNSYNAELNADDYSQTERLIRYKFVIKVPGYILASGTPGAPVPIKRYVSSPTISFQTGVLSDVQVGQDDVIDDPFLGSDDPTLPMNAGDDGRSNRKDQRRTGSTRLFPQHDVISPHDPALQALPRGTSPARFQKVIGIDKNGKKVTKLVRIKSINRFTGETVISDGELGGLTIVLGDG